MAKVISDAAQAAAELSAAVDQATSMVFFGGAGVSTASGIPDFRSEDGLYHQHFKYPPEEMLSHDFYVTHTEEFFGFYRTRMIALGAKPNQAHLQLAELERAGKLTAVVTQNIDGLHRAAGSKNVLELHGSVHRNLCQRCGRVYSAEWIMGTEGAPRCPECGGAIKPDVVLYGESLDEHVLTASVGGNLQGRPAGHWRHVPGGVPGGRAGQLLQWLQAGHCQQAAHAPGRQR